MGVSRLQLLKDCPKLDLPTQTDELSGRSMSQHRSLSQSPASEYFESLPDIPPIESIGISTETNPSQRSDIVGRASKGEKRQGPLSDSNLVTPTAEWFLSIVPHESSVTALVVRPRSEQARHLKAQAETTARTLVLNWTNIDPDSVFGDDLGGLDNADNSHFHNPGPARDQQSANPPYQMPYNPQPYPTYAPQPWHRPTVVTLPPSTETASSPPPPKEKEKDSEELIRLKKLILDEKAEQDRRATASLPTPVPPIATDDLREDTIQRNNTYMDAVGSPHAPHEYSKLWKVEHPRVQPVIMRDWLGRKFIFPVDMCQTWAVGNQFI